jgi:hypothetical protein
LFKRKKITFEKKTAQAVTQKPHIACGLKSLPLKISNMYIMHVK